MAQGAREEMDRSRRLARLLDELHRDYAAALEESQQVEAFLRAASPARDRRPASPSQPQARLVVMRPAVRA